MSATNSTDEKMLQVQEICQIIKACADAGVTSLKCGPLELSFGKQTEKIPEEKPAVTEITDNERKQIKEDSLTQDDVALRTDQIAMMLVENPSKAKELIASGDLVDDDADTDE